jgi:hypothetical protein
MRVRRWDFGIKRVIFDHFRSFWSKSEVFGASGSSSEVLGSSSEVLGSSSEVLGSSPELLGGSSELRRKAGVAIAAGFNGFVKITV